MNRKLCHALKGGHNSGNYNFLFARKATSVAVIAALATTTVLVTSGTEAFAYPIPSCVNPISGTIEGCLSGNQDLTITSSGSIIAPNIPKALDITTNYTSTLINNGTISATNTNTDMAGIYLYSMTSTSGSVTNNGTINVTLHDPQSEIASGILVDHGTALGSITNTGAINVSSTDGGGLNYLIGINVDTPADNIITNNGTITITANNHDNTANGYGIFATGLGVDGTLTNNGTISVSMTSSGEAYAVGINIYGTVDGNIINSGAINATAHSTGDAVAGAWGMYVNNDVDGSIVNNGTINASAIANSKSISAYGIQVSGAVNGSITNNGSITATATTGNSRPAVYGINVSGNVTGNITNNGSISATANANNAHAYAYGIDIQGDLDGILTNNGSITASSTVVDDAPYAYGIYINGNIGVDDAIINNGTISATGAGSYEPAVYGIYDNGTVNGSIINNGTINATANDPEYYGYAGEGIFANIINGSIINNGTINATATGLYEATAYGINVNTVNVGGAIVNHGTINATTINQQSHSGKAYGIYVGVLDGSITNTGTVTVTYDYAPDNGYSVYVDGGNGTVNNSGTLTGNLLLGGTVSMANSGTINLPSAVNNAEIDGNYTGAGNGTINFGVASNAHYAQLAILGTADFTSGNGLRVVLDPGNTYSGGTLTNVIQGDTALTHPNGFTVTDNSIAYNFTASVSGNNVNLVPTSTGLTTFSAAVAATGNSSGAGAASELDYLLTNGSPAMIGELSTLIGGVTINQQASNIVSELLPLLSGAANQATLENMHTVDDIIQARLDSDTGLSSGDFTTDRYFWLKPFGSWANQSNSGGISGYSADTGGMAVGGDTLVNAKTRLGGGFVYSHSNVDSNNDVAPQSDHIDTYQGIVYGSYSLNDRTDANFQADIGDNSNNGHRDIAIASSTAYSNYDSWAEHVGAGIGQTYNLDAKTLFVPSLRADYANINSQSYTESGAGLMDLHVKGEDAQELIFGVNGKVQRPICDHVTLTANLGVGYDAINDRASIASNFVGGGAAYLTRGVDQSPWLGRAGAGIVVNEFQNAEISLRYDLEARTEYTDQTASLKLRMPF